jgi:hypothetical protein
VNLGLKSKNSAACCGISGYVADPEPTGLEHRIGELLLLPKKRLSQSFTAASDAHRVIYII